ncbi:hypothetical protein [Tenacibaculum sp. nBUS_03]|uniref:hypothetical protein n=1 Tax=Tenacibaculum sp. nBUS_03 TaxID=3395320 RepID=UPI003EBFEB31
MITSKKPFYSLSKYLHQYLEKYSRWHLKLLTYDELLFCSVLEKENEQAINNLSWVRVKFKEAQNEYVDLQLKKIYTALMSDGTCHGIQFLHIDCVDYYRYGNSNPFRVKIRNILNDNYLYFYVKKMDSSRVYGLELEHLLSPDNVNYLAFSNTLIEEHIIGIPGTVFIKNRLASCSTSEKAQLAKEFVKFNKRSLIRLLGDMRSDNYVIIPMYDFDKKIYKIRAIDFDQQSYEGDYKNYLPQFFKENLLMVSLVRKSLTKETIHQYKQEERSIIAKRILSAKDRIENLLQCMRADSISNSNNIKKLSLYFYKLTLDVEFKKVPTMGALLERVLNRILVIS